MQMIDTIVSAIIGMICGNLMALLLFPQKRKSENLKNAAQDIENEAKQSNEWHKLYEEERDENKALNQKIDALYDEISKLRDRIVQLLNQISELLMENTKLKILKCEKPSCPNRQPPTGY